MNLRALVILEWWSLTQLGLVRLLPHFLHILSREAKRFSGLRGTI